jgi:hypothetical protein
MLRETRGHAGVILTADVHFDGVIHAAQISKEPPPQIDDAAT